MSWKIDKNRTGPSIARHYRSRAGLTCAVAVCKTCETLDHFEIVVCIIDRGRTFMNSLVLNELLKIALRARTWVMISITVIVVGWSVLLVPGHSQERSDWRKQLVSQDVRFEQTLANRHNFLSHNAQAAIGASLAVNKYELTHDLPPTGEMDAWAFVDEGLPLSGIVVVFATVIAGDVVAGEFAAGTIKTLLSQSATRSQILASKYIAVLLTTLVMIASVLVSSLLLGGIFFGFSGADYPYIFMNNRETIGLMTEVNYALIAYYYQFLSAVMTVTIAFMISTVFRSGVLSIAISIITWFIGSTLAQFLSSYSWDKYIIFSNTDLLQYITGSPIIDGTTMGFAIFMLVAYFIVLNVISWTVFVHRDVLA